MSLHVALRCDARPDLGTGHVVRCLALADELTSRGARVTLLGEVTGVPWLEAQVAQRGLDVVAAPAQASELADLARALGIAAMVLDGYSLDPGCPTALRAAGCRTLSIVDGPFGLGQDADLFLDQNLGAVPGPGRPSQWLAGLEYVLFRDEVLRHRQQSVSPAAPRRVPRVLAVFGGTDPYAAGLAVVPIVLSTGRPVHIIAVAARPEIAAALASLETGPGQVVEVAAPTPDLAALAVTCDLAVTAAGSSVWEFLCLGVPAGLVCVIDNQRVGYDAVARSGVALPLGHLDRLRHDPHEIAAARDVLREILHSPSRRAALASAGMQLVDGHGRSRVVDALLELTELAPRRGTESENDSSGATGLDPRRPAAGSGRAPGGGR